MAKVFYVKEIHSTRNGSRTTIWEGTIDYLKSKVFGYTLDCGASWNPKINSDPKSLKSLVSNLNKSDDEIHGSCFTRNSYYESTKEEFDSAEAKGWSVSKMTDDE